MIFFFFIMVYGIHSTYNSEEDTVGPQYTIDKMGVLKT